MVKPRENRVPIMLSEEELTAIDDWRFNNRVATRSEAIRKLCRMGLVLDEKIDELQQKAIASAQLYEALIPEIKELYSDKDRPAIDVARTLSMRLPDMLDALKALSKVGLEIFTFARPYRSTADLAAVEELLGNLRKALTDIDAELLQPDKKPGKSA